MKDVTFHAASPDHGLPHEYEPSLFHLPGHLTLQHNSGWTAFYALNQKQKRIVASLYVNILEKKGTTAVRSPFGSIECAVDISAETLFAFVRFIDESLKELVDEVTFKLSPEAYAPRANAFVISFLHAVGFQTSQVDLAACIKIEGSFGDSIRKSESQVLHKAKQSGLTATIMAEEQLAEVYNFIAHHHALKNYPVSMSWSNLEKTVALFPDRYLTFGVHRDDNTLVAAAVSVRVSSQILSLFYIDHDSQYDRLSPPVLLIAALYDYCLKHQISLLDLGTSSLPDGPNINLLSFKMRMGAQPSIKPILKKVYRDA